MTHSVDPVIVGAALSLLDATPDATLVVDADGRIGFVNARAEQMFGYDRSELIGHPIEILVPEGSRTHHASQREGYVGDPKVTQEVSGVGRVRRRESAHEGFPTIA